MNNNNANDENSQFKKRKQRTIKSNVSINDYTDKKIKRMFYYPKSVLEEGYQKLKQCSDDKKIVLHQREFLVGCNYLRSGHEFETVGKKFNICEKQAQLDTWKLLDLLEFIDDGVVATDKNSSDLEIEDLVSGPGQIITLSIDTYINKIKLHKNGGFQTPKYGFPGYKYLIGADLVYGKIYFCSGPYNSTKSDIECYRDQMLYVKRKPNERYIGDKGFHGEPSIVCPKNSGPKNTLHDKMNNAYIKSLRIIIENVIRILRRWKFSEIQWKSNALRHQQATRLNIFLYNISIQQNIKNNIKKYNYDDDGDDVVPPATTIFTPSELAAEQSIEKEINELMYSAIIGANGKDIWSKEEEEEKIDAV